MSRTWHHGIKAQYWKAWRDVYHKVYALEETQVQVIGHIQYKAPVTYDFSAFPFAVKEWKIHTVDVESFSVHARVCLFLQRFKTPWWAETNYSRNPRWFNNMHTERPNRRLTKFYINAILNYREEPDNIEWPLANKPKDYYW